MYIRDLQSRVQFLRQDLPNGFVNQALQDAARWVARKTGIVRVKAYGSVSAQTVRINLPTFMNATTNDFVVLRPTQLMYCPGLDRNAVALGVLTATATTIPLASAATAFGFYIASSALTASDGVTSYPMREGDVIVAVNRVWVITPFYKFKVAHDLSKSRLLNTHPSPLNSVGYFTSYVVERDAILLSPVPVNDVAIMLECSVVPNKEFDSVEFPIDAEDAIIAAAKAQIYGTPNKTGGGADLRSAAAFQARAEGEVSLVRAISEGGYGETEMSPPPRFGA